MLCATVSWGADTYNLSTGQLTIPTLSIGSATYSNVIVRIGTIVSGPTGTVPLGTVDTYNPASNLLTVQSVSVGGTVYYNAAATVASLVSIGSVSGADSYSGGQLRVSSAQAGSTIYTNVVAEVDTIVAVGGGMPTIARDSYDQANNQLLIPAAVYLGKVYTNVIVTVANIVSVGGSGAGGGGLANYIVTTLAGSSAIGAADGTGPAASFWSPQGVTVDYHGNVYVADTNNSVIREISPAGAVATIAGQGIGCFPSLPPYCDGAGPYATFYIPDGLAVDSYGNLFVADTDESVIRKISPSVLVSTLAGSTPAGSKDGPGLLASFYGPADVAVDGNGNVYVTDTEYYLLRKIAPDAQATVTTVASLSAQPWDIAADAAGNVYFTEPGANTIGRMTPAGVMSTLAGSGYTGDNCQSTDGQGANATLCGPWGIAIDCLGNVYTTENATGLIRMISPAGKVTTIAGMSGLGGITFANGPALLATFWGPEGIAVDSNFNLYVADSNNNMIRKLTPGSTGTLCSTILRSIAIEPENPTVTPGNTLQLHAIGIYADGSSRDFNGSVIWKSATTSVATISSSGLVTATAAGGTSLITAAHGSVPAGSTTLDAAWFVGGTLSGLISGNTIGLQDNGADALTLGNNGPFTFPTPLANGAPYSLGIQALPANQPCTSLYGAAAVNSFPVTNIDVFCGPSPPIGNFAAAGTPLAGRFNHTATRLANGQVLVAGGQSGSVTNLASAELYDPPSDTWSAAAAMVTGAENHTATLLANGQVLVVDDGTTVAQLYDPVANSWAAAARLAAGHTGHTATRLINGKVLIVGVPGAGIQMAELYDPAANTWAPAGSGLTEPVYSHAAVLLPDGRVLITGGFEQDVGASASTAAAYLYQPSSNSWSAAAPMKTSRGGHAMNLLPDGTVLVVGGATSTPAASSPLASAERYSPAANTWSSAGSMATARENFTATLLPTGQVLAVGGIDPPAPGALDSAELFDPGSNTWSLTGTLVAPREYYTATLLLDGEPLLVGGQDGAGNTLDSAELYW